MLLFLTLPTAVLRREKPQYASCEQGVSHADRVNTHTEHESMYFYAPGYEMKSLHTRTTHKYDVSKRLMITLLRTDMG